MSGSKILRRWNRPKSKLVTGKPCVFLVKNRFFRGKICENAQKRFFGKCHPLNFFGPLERVETPQPTRACMRATTFENKRPLKKYSEVISCLQKVSTGQKSYISRNHIKELSNWPFEARSIWILWSLQFFKFSEMGWVCENELTVAMLGFVLCHALNLYPVHVCHVERTTVFWTHLLAVDRNLNPKYHYLLN